MTERGEGAIRQGYVQAVDRLGLLPVLAEFDPRIAGTPPLGLDLPDSDIDILCCVPRADVPRFTQQVWALLSALEDFGIWQWASAPHPVIASFSAHGWAFEIFASPEPVDQQPGWRHFCVERRLLDLGGPAFRQAVMERRRMGRKTEPAFAEVLGLTGDPYAGVMRLADETDCELAGRLAAAGFMPAKHVLP